MSKKGRKFRLNKCERTAIIVGLFHLARDLDRNPGSHLGISSRVDANYVRALATRFEAVESDEDHQQPIDKENTP